jgi:hypothetical protein
MLKNKKNKTRDMLGAQAAWKLSNWIEPWGETRFPIDVDLLATRAHTMYQREDRITQIVPGPWQDFEGFLQRNPDNPKEWLMSYREDASPERQRFTKAHELGHYVLHAQQAATFRCGSRVIVEEDRGDTNIEAQANQFASHLLMPSKHVIARILHTPITLDLVGALAALYGVSFQAMCIRIVEVTAERAVLIHWDNGMLLRWSRSEPAQLQRLWIDRSPYEPLEPFPGTLAADETVRQCPEGREVPAHLWFKNAPKGVMLREMKHTSDKFERVLSLLIVPKFESLYTSTEEDEEPESDTYDRFISRGQYPVR